jgi:hypothetical protein
MVTGTVADRLAAIAGFGDYLTQVQQQRAERRAALLGRHAK